LPLKICPFGVFPFDVSIERQNEPIGKTINAIKQEDNFMKYMLLMYANESEAPKYTAEEHQTVAQAWYAFGQEAKAAGVLLGNNGLASIQDATTLRIRAGKTLVVDGPFAETHEQLGGYYLLECKDLDEALAWAAKIPIAQYGSIEVRPLNSWSQQA
jgi:hypothetical protein